MIPLLPFLAFGLGMAFGDAQIGRFERLAAADIAQKLSGPDKRVMVKAEFGGIVSALSGDISVSTIRAENFSTEGLPLLTEPHRSRRGRIRKLVLDLRDFTLAGLRIDALHAEIPSCRYDLGLAVRYGKVRLSKSGVGTGWVNLREQDLANYILRKFHEIKRCTVKIDEGQIVVDGYGEFVVAKTEFNVIASLESPDGNNVMLTNTRIRLSAGTNTPEAQKVLLDILNPVVDLKSDLGLRDAIKITKLEMKKGSLTAYGATTIPEAGDQ